MLGAPPKARAAALEEALPLAVLSLRLKRDGAGVLAKQPPPKNPLEWAYRHRRLEDRPFSLDEFLPLEALYLDDHRHIVVMKPAQRGVSELAINFAMFALEEGPRLWGGGMKNGLNVGYIFPTVDALGDFSKERLSGMEDETPHLARLFGEHDEYNAVRFKEVKSGLGGSSYLYLRGGWSSKALKSFPCDVLIRDEYDEHTPQARALALRRLNASRIRRVLDLSTPTLPGHGIHKAYMESDQRIYRQTHSCGARVNYEFHRDVMVDEEPYSLPDNGGWRNLPGEEIRKRRVWLRCPSCQGEVTKGERVARGEWVVTNPAVLSVHGYHIPWWPWPFLDLEDLAVAAVSTDPSELEQFYHSDLGLPYGGSGNSISLEDIAATHRPAEKPDGLVSGRVLGVDVGTRLHYWATELVGGREVALEAGSTGSFEELYYLIDRLRPLAVVIDSMPEQHEVTKLKAKYPGRVISAGYPANALGLQAQMLSPNKEGKPNRDAIITTGHVQVNRTLAMDAVSAAVKGRVEWWPAEIANDREVREHLTSPTRVIVVNDKGEPKPQWVHSKPDHLFHARVYALVARQIMVEEAPTVSSAPPPRGGYHANRRRMV